MTGRTIAADGSGGYATTDDPTGILAAAPRWALFLARFRRRRGPTVRYWDAEMNYLGRDPIPVESWPVWSRRQLRRLVRR